MTAHEEAVAALRAFVRSVAGRGWDVDLVADASDAIDSLVAALSQAQQERDDARAELTRGVWVRPNHPDADNVHAALTRQVQRAEAQAQQLEEAARIELGRHFCYTSEDAQRRFWRDVYERAGVSPVPFAGEGTD